MKNTLLYLAFTVAIAACNTEAMTSNNDTEQTEPATEDNTTNDSTKSVAKAPIYTRSTNPIVSDELLSMAKHLDSAGYMYNPDRLKNLPNAVGAVKNEGYTFLNFPFNETPLYKRGYPNGWEEGRVDTLLVGSTTSIINYFYVVKQPDTINNEKWYTDGWITELSYPTDSIAKLAAMEIQDKSEWIFFNTMSFCCRIENRVYVFHTRAMAFSFTMQPFFEWFVEQYNGKAPREAL